MAVARLRALRWISYACCVASGLPAFSQQEATPPANAFKGVVPGKVTREEALKTLGEPVEGLSEGGSDRYAVAGMPGVTDRVFYQGRERTLALVSAATVDPRYARREEIAARLGEPEARVRFQTEELLDYSEKGLRFICDASGKTIGSLYFAAGERHVPAGYPNDFDLRVQRKTAPCPAEAPADFRVGAAEISIAPERFDDVAADAKKNTYTLHEDLLARVAIFQRGEQKIVLAGLDVFGMSPWDLRALRQSLAGKGFSQVIIAMSHTHANVDTIGFYGYYPKAYAEHIVRQTEKAVLAAAAEMRPVRSLKIGSVEMPLTGGRVVDLVWNGRDPGWVDPVVSVIQAIGTDGRPIVNVVHLACHPEVIRREAERGLSPDYVGTLCKEVHRQLGGQAVFLNGALGGMLTPDAPKRGYASAEMMGKRFAAYAMEAAKAARPSSSYTLWMHRRPVEYPLTAEAILKFLQHAPGPVDLHEGRVRTEMNALWIGDAQLITVPGELLPEIGFDIRSHMTGRVRLIVGLANDELGYLIPSYDFRAGHYEERTGPGAAGGVITRMVGLELSRLGPGGSEKREEGRGK